MNTFINKISNKLSQLLLILKGFYVKNKKIVLPLFIILALVLVGILVFIFINRSKPVSNKKTDDDQYGIVAKVTMPDSNKMAYTRCQIFDYRYSKQCILYIAQMGSPETEARVYTFKFPDMQNKDYDSAYLKLQGIFGDKIIYTQPIKVGSTISSRIGYIDLSIQKDVEVFTQTYKPDSFYPDEKYIFYFDNNGGKIYYSEYDAENKNPKIYQFDLASGQKKLIFENKSDQNPEESFYYRVRSVMYANDEYVYLIGGDLLKDPVLVYNLKTDSISRAPQIPNSEYTAFSSTGKIAYSEDSKNYVNKYEAPIDVYLFMSNIDGTNKQKLYTLTAKVGIEGGTEGGISNISFSPDGTKLLAEISYPHDDKKGDISEHRFWDVGTIEDTHTPAKYRIVNEGGIYIMPKTVSLPNSTLLKATDPLEFEMTDRWVETRSGKMIYGHSLISRGQGGQYSGDYKNWYFISDLDDLVDSVEDGTFNYIKNPEFIALKAESLVVAP